jgi:hydroxymethylpyrimidine pyrophosphatase-like HAD family hydrolase
MDIRCIALDLDRTTLNEHARLSEGNRKALEHAISKGVHIVIASGRGFASLPQDVISIPGIEYAITSNGASVYHSPSGKRLMSYTLDPESVQKILDLTAGMHLAYEAFIDGVAYAQADYVENPGLYGAANATQYIQSTRIPISDFRSFLLEHRTELESIDLVVSSEEQMAEPGHSCRPTSLISTSLRPFISCWNSPIAMPESTPVSGLSPTFWESPPLRSLLLATVTTTPICCLL